MTKILRGFRVSWLMGYMKIAILKSLGCSKEAINEGMSVNANSRIERGRTPKFSGGAKSMRVSRRGIRGGDGIEMI